MPISNRATRAIRRAWLENVRLCVETGVAGLSIEDSTGDRAKPLYDLPVAVERMKAARAAIDDTGSDVLLIGRAECFLVGHPEPLKESIRRLQAYAEAGADVLYAPGVQERADIQAIVSAVSPKPVNVLMSANTGLKVSGSGGAGRATDQRGEFAGAGGLGRIHPGGEGDRGGRKLRGFRQRCSVRRTEWFLPGRFQKHKAG